MEKFALFKLEKLQQGNNLELDLSLTLQLGEDNFDSSEIIQGHLDSFQPVIDRYQTWHADFKQLLNELKQLNQVNNSRAIKKRFIPSKETLNDSESEALAKVQETTVNCRNKANSVAEALNNWLTCEDLDSIITKLSELATAPSESSLIIQAEDSLLLKLPWHLWNHFGREVTLSTLAYQRLERPAPKNPRIKVRILAIFGDDKGINIEQDRQNLARLTNADLIYLDQPQRKELYEQLWDEEGYDILFFAGHSSSQLEDEQDVIFFNSQEKLEINKLKEALRAAIGLGLKLAIFNSCDGLGLGQKLADLNIPQVIVMREEVPNLVAQTFLQYFLEPFAGGQSLSAAMQQARRALQENLDTKLPGASWLPVIWQNPTETPLTWQELPGIRVEPTWRGCCRAMLVKAAIQRLGNNMLAAGEGLGYELEEIYVPLGLVERKKSERRREDVSPETGSQLYQPELEYEVTKVYQQQEFFEEVLDRGNSPKSQGRRLVLIGEPGAGKTTLLQKIGNWVLDSTTEAVPIWISLADLQGQSLASYLRENWLDKAMSTIQVPEGNEDGLRQLFQSGKVWLLLDGVDELSTTSANPIVELVNQLTGWVTEARLVLTCRLNLWETAKETFEDFDVYRNLDFSYGDIYSPEDQVKQFVDRWFNYNRTLGSNLRSQLDEPGRERIRDLVKNPLRLSLLCRTWQWQQGSLPRTKAELYRQFTEAVYQWKQNIFPTTTTEQEELNRALSRLAKKALSQPRSRFRLASNWVTEELGEFDSPLMQRALQIGWINQVGVAAENPSEKVYAFFHPTFQEYFAARAISDWHDFLTHDNNYPPQGIYRVFEPQWRETILLWLGREDIPHQAKEEFFEALLNFQDGCGHFYEWQTFFLAAAGTAEFLNSSYSEQIIAQIVVFGFGYFDAENQAWQTFSETITKAAQEVLIETETTVTINSLINLLLSSSLVSNLDFVKPPNLDISVFKSLEKIAIGNQKAISALMQLLQNNHNEQIGCQIIESLLCIGRNNPEVINTINQLIQTNENKHISKNIISLIGKYRIANHKTINILIDLMFNSSERNIRHQSELSLKEIVSNNISSILIEPIIDLLHASQNEEKRLKIASLLADSSSDRVKDLAIEVLIELLHNSRNTDIRRQATFICAENVRGVHTLISLLNSNVYKSEIENYLWGRSIVGFFICKFENICKGNLDAIDTLIKLLHNNENESNLRHIAKSLAKIGVGNSDAINALIKLLQNSENEYTRRSLVESLAKIGVGNSDAINALIKLLQNSENEYTRWLIAEKLGQISPAKSEAIITLIHLILSSNDDGIRRDSARRLWEESPSFQQIAIDVLIDMLNTHLNERYVAEDSKKKDKYALIKRLHFYKKENPRNEKEYSCQQIAFILSQIGVGNSKVIDAIINLIRNTEDANTLRKSVWSLGRIGSGNSKAIEILIELLFTLDCQKNSDTYYQVIEVLTQIGFNNSNVIFTLIKLLHSSQSWGFRTLATNNLKQILRKQDFGMVVSSLNGYITKTYYGSDDSDRSENCYDLIWYCAKKLSYPDFYQAWNNQSSISLLTQPSTTKEKIAEIIAKLKSTSNTYLISINVKALMTNSQRELIFQIKQNMFKPNIALVLYNAEPNPELIKFYQELIHEITNLYIGWITFNVLPPPLRTFSPREPNLINTILSWLDEID